MASAASSAEAKPSSWAGPPDENAAVAESIKDPLAGFCYFGLWARDRTFGSFPEQRFCLPCRRKMRMSGLCKVEMSAFMGGRGAHGDGANGLESTRTGSHRSVARSTARTCNPGGRARRLHLS